MELQNGYFYSGVCHFSRSSVKINENQLISASGLGFAASAYPLEVVYFFHGNAEVCTAMDDVAQMLPGS